MRLLDTQPDLVEDNDAVELDDIKGHIKLDKVHFSYLEGEEVLHDISIDIKPKQRLAIVGPTGAGKTTIISLIPRFYDVDSGSITIDDVDVKHYQFESLRRNIGMVLQDNFLFADTILENIRYGNLTSTD